MNESVFVEVTDDFTFVGNHKIESKSSKVYQILVRPDIAEDILLVLCEQVMLSYCGAVSLHGIKPPSLLGDTAVETSSLSNIISPFLESTKGALSGAGGLNRLWESIRVYLGVNMDLNRCIMLSVQPTTAAALVLSTAGTSADAAGSSTGRLVRGGHPGVGSYHPTTADLNAGGIGKDTGSASAAGTNNTVAASPAAGTVVASPFSFGAFHSGTTAAAAAVPVAVSSSRQAFLDFVDTIAQELHTALREESLTIDYMHSVPASMAGPVQGIHYGGGIGGVGGGRIMTGSSSNLNSIIDLNFIRDLQAAAAQLMVLLILFYFLECVENFRL
jgi:hypothetical protein